MDKADPRRPEVSSFPEIRRVQNWRWQCCTFFAKLAKAQGLPDEELEREFIAKNRLTSLIRRLATVEEVANMVVYACSPQASATIAAALRVDGGVVRSIA